MTGIALRRRAPAPVLVPPVTEAPASPTPAELGARVDEYLHHQQHLRNASPHTITAYRRALASFFRHLDGPLSGVAIRSWLGDLDRANLGPRTRALYLAAVRAYAKWDTRERDTDAWRVLLARRTPRTPRPLPLWFKAGQIERLFAALEQRTDGVGWRDRALIEFAYSTGARLAEVVGVNLNDLDLDMGDVLLRAKGRKELRVPLGRPAREALGNWLAYRSKVAPEDPAVFLGIGTHGECRGRLSPRGLQLIFEKLTTEVFGTPIRFHALRHSCASHMLDAGADLRAIQDMLGHVNINATCVYTHTALARLGFIHRKAHPRDKMEVSGYRGCGPGRAAEGTP